MADVELKKLKKVYGKDVLAIKGADVSIKDKEFVVLVGPSGCGKSTLLRMIAGLEEISDGDLYIDDTQVLMEMVSTPSGALRRKRQGVIRPFPRPPALNRPPTTVCGHCCSMVLAWMTKY